MGQLMQRDGSHPLHVEVLGDFDAEMVQGRVCGGLLSLKFRARDGMHIEVALTLLHLEKRSRLLR